jgi:Spy/CpxP family protein refolding chaperone
MKRLLAAAMLLLLASVVGAGQVHAQGGGGGQGRGGPGRLMEMMMRGITLTDAQKAQVDSIQAAYAKEMPAFTPGTPPSEEDRTKRMQLMQKQQAAIRGVLNDEQKAVFDKNMEEMRNRRPPGA